MKNRRAQEKQASYAFVLVFAILAACIVTAGYLYYQNYENRYTLEVERQLSAVAELKVDQLVQWRKERLGNAGVLYDNAAFSDLVQRYFEAPGDAEAQGQLRAWLSQVQSYYEYDRLSLLDAGGVERMSLPAARQPVAAVIAQRAVEVLRSGQVTLQDFYRDDVDQRVYLALVVPILDRRGDNRALGVLILRIDPERYLYPLISRWPTPSQTAETLLVRRDGNDALFLNELKFELNTSLTLRIPLASTDVPAVKAAVGQQGTVEGTDYRGVPVVADVRAVPDSPWFLVARMDVAEVYAPVRERLWLLIAFVGALLLGAGAGVGLVWRQQNVRLYRERYETAEALRESDARYRLLAEHMTGTVWLMDMNLKTTYNSPSIEKLRAYTTKEIEQLPLEKHMTPDSLKRAMDVFTEELERVQADPNHSFLRTLELEFYRKDGSTFWSENTFSLVRDERGMPEAILGEGRDITERRRGEEALQESVSELRRAEAIAHLGHWSLDLRTNCFTWSDELCRIYGVSPQDFQPTYEGVAHLVHPDDRAYHDQVTETIRRQGEAEFGYRVLRPDGEVRHVTGYGQLVRDEAGEAVAMFGTILDTTELRHKERELQEKNAEMERFTYTVSHDLKSPLVTVKTFLGYLEEDMSRADAGLIQQDMGYVRSAADKMGQMLDELLEMSRVGRVANPPLRVAFRELVDEALSIVAGHISARGVEVRVDEAAVTLVGDRPRLVEIWQNLVENAVKFMGDQASPRIEIGVEGHGWETVFFVRDNGMGIDPRHQAKVFGLFEKLDPLSEGTGLGLALVKRIVEVYHGAIWLESQGAGQGACFRFTLPDAVEDQQGGKPS